MATRYDKLASNFLAMVQLASMRLWLRAYDDYAIEALSRMSERGCRHLPVLDQGRLVGIVSRRDFLGEEIILVEEEFGHEQRF